MASLTALPARQSATDPPASQSAETPILPGMRTVKPPATQELGLVHGEAWFPAISKLYAKFILRSFWPWPRYNGLNGNRREIQVCNQQLSTMLEDPRVFVADEIRVVLLVMTMRVVLSSGLNKGER